ncbi:hypothetical protein APS60_07675 [Cutibacterium acnes]|uniref:Uncharacterized protein n=1 Tax=Cutibacterium acnes TaxID=1747 RepID=A0AA44ZEG1_CUTAC|nr:hypothetical protein HMPREF9577_01416 [Cutibacterium acnes HL110PA3]EFT62743.1 hypothetical protein HMPREF9578_02022 [Cutibacterium acnes HL110PA4]EFT76217.1 hypothetical protein HMPREF9599_02505 [Cutibacterium acnes HL050PA2]PEN29266.1 hypothetical protein APS59_08230 [Cutibacterium acnes]PGF25402.1 hypothetical protein B1B02_10355 [Cutibacterium acnes subsp. defendens]
MAQLQQSQYCLAAILLLPACSIHPNKDLYYHQADLRRARAWRDRYEYCRRLPITWRMWLRLD